MTEASKTLRRAATGRMAHGVQPGQMAGPVSGDAWPAGLLDLRCLGERGGALPLHGILLGSSELEADRP